MGTGDGLVVDGVRVRLGGREILDGISLTCGTGVTAVVGPNGSGKTTLLRAITGLIPLERGRVSIGGNDLVSQTRQARAGLGFLPQRSSFPRRLTVREALAYAAWLQALGEGKTHHRIDELAVALGLDAVLESRIGTLSGGTMQRVLLAQSIIHDPPVLLLDEPTVGLDLAQQVSFKRLVRALAERKTVVMTTHLKDDVEALADRIILLGSGRVMWSGRLDELRDLASEAEIGGLVSDPDSLEMIEALVRDPMGQGGE